MTTLNVDEIQHSSAPDGCRCADCYLHDDPCPQCYTAWWKKKYPNTYFIGEESEVKPLSSQGDYNETRKS